MMMDDSFHSMFCPSMCSGKGICDWDAKPAPVCKCYDGSDTSEGCFNSPPNDPNVAFEMSMSRFVFSISMLVVSVTTWI